MRNEGYKPSRRRSGTQARSRRTIITDSVVLVGSSRVNGWVVISGFGPSGFGPCGDVVEVEAAGATACGTCPQTTRVEFRGDHFLSSIRSRRRGRRLGCDAVAPVSAPYGRRRG